MFLIVDYHVRDFPFSQNFTQFISFYEFLDIAQKGYIHLTCLGMQSFNL